MKQTSHTVTDWLEKRARLTADRLALIDYATGKETTYAAWNARANRTANYLRSLGIEKGDRVAVYASNCPEYLDLYWAAAKIGAILQNLNWRLTVHELEGIVRSGAPKVLLYSKDWQSQVEDLKPSLDSVEYTVALADPGAGERDFSERDAHSEILEDRPDLTPWVSTTRAARPACQKAPC